jgi:hypothetical protein
MEIIDYKCVYFTFGRFQPPTIGHAENFNAVASKAGRCDYYIYLSQTQKQGTDPLPPGRKLYYAKKIFPNLKANIRTGKDPVSILSELQSQGYDDAVMVVGSDRVQAMQWIKRYNGKDYTFRKLDIISSGQRDADGDTFAISGTKMRRAAAAGDFESFKAGIPKALGSKETRNLMDEIAELL